MTFDRMIDRETRTQDNTLDIIMEAEVDQIVDMINNMLINQQFHCLRYLENKMAQNNHPRIVGDKWTLADIHHCILGCG